MDKHSLLKKANELPLTPGVYIMKNKNGQVIYVGKSRSLKNRVSQYFVNTPHGAKTDKMVSQVDDFDFILCDTELEALALENSKIKQFKPKYNIKLKDGKTYPYISIEQNTPFPKLVFTRKRTDDGDYYGPYSSSATAYEVIRTVSKAFLLPDCKRVFPRDIGKYRPCLNYQICRCSAPCSGRITPEEYAIRLAEAKKVLSGNIASVADDIKKQMYEASENLEFERAAGLRDTLSALERLYTKQKVVSTPSDFRDVVGIYRDDAVCAVSVFYIRSGIISDTDNFEFTSGQMDDWEKLSSFIISVYEKRTFYPPQVMISSVLPENEAKTIEDYLNSVSDRKVQVVLPKRGDKVKLCEMVEANAKLRAERFKNEEKSSELLSVKLASLLGLEVVPERIEAYDISNIGDEAITGGMIVVDGTKFDKSSYKVFNIKTANGQDDYLSMREMLERRMQKALDGEKSFLPLPDLILIDGGQAHAQCVKQVLEKMGIGVPVFGMFKDEFHKTRGLTDGENEVGIACDRDLFMLIYKIQEEVHRFTVSKMTGKKRKTLSHSTLTNVKGIGDAKAKAIMKHFTTLQNVKNASVDELVQVSGVTRELAQRITEYFKENKK